MSSGYLRFSEKSCTFYVPIQDGYVFDGPNQEDESSVLKAIDDYAIELLDSVENYIKEKSIDTKDFDYNPYMDSDDKNYSYEKWG